MAAPALGPLSSMTGYGRGSAENEIAAAEVELRSVNGKGLHLKLRLPADRLELESTVEARVRAQIERGSLHGSLRVRVLGGAAPGHDRAALANHLREWRRTSKELGLDQRDPALSELLAMPGAFLPAAETGATTKAVRQVALQAVDAALTALCEARTREGARLARELQRLLKQFAAQLKQAEARVPLAVEAAQDKLRERVRAALEAAGEDADRLDLARELVALADRADVREEVARLQIHLGALQDLLLRGGPCGREIEFLLQEVHREVTTLGNKSADLTLSESVVAMKLLAGQLKEQVANVE